MLTGLFYIDTTQPSLVDLMGMVDTPLVHLSESELRPSRDALRMVMDAL